MRRRSPLPAEPTQVALCLNGADFPTDPIRAAGVWPSMKKMLPLLAFLGGALASPGSAEAPEPTYTPDARALEQVIAAAEADARAAQAPPATGAAPSPGLAAADRMSATLARVEPAGIDPNVLARLVER